MHAKRLRRRRAITAAVVAVLSVLSPVTATAAVFYVGAFTGSIPLDDADCGTGLGAHPAAHPCASLAYWTNTRQGTGGALLQAGDTVRYTGTFDTCGTTGAPCTAHCVRAFAGVTFEGRQANNAPSAGTTDAIIDASVNTGSGSTQPCYGAALMGQDLDSTNTTIRHFWFKRSPRSTGSPAGITFSVDNGSTICPGPGGSCNGLTIDTVRVSDNPSNGGMVIGNTGNGGEDIPCNNQYDFTNVTIRNLEADHNNGHGFMLTCVDGFTVTDSSMHHNYNQTNGCDPNNAVGSGSANCGADGISGLCGNQHDGFFFGAKNGYIDNVEVYQNGQDNFDFGSLSPQSCDAPGFNIYARRLNLHDPICGTNLSLSHCDHDVTVVDSFIHGPRGNGINQKSCFARLRLYNNTFWMTGTNPAMFFFQGGRGSEFVNNIFHCEGANPCVRLSSTMTTATEGRWDHNVVQTLGGGVNAIKDFPSVGAESCNDSTDCRDECNIGAYFAGTCTTGGEACCSNQDCLAGTCAGANCDPQHPGFPPGWANAPSPLGVTAAQLATFQGDANWFPSGHGTGDAWSTTWAAGPQVVSTASPLTATKLHLAAGDTVAAAKGIPIPTPSPFGTPVADYDNSPLTGANWPIGADAIAPTSTPTPTATATPVDPCTSPILINPEGGVVLGTTVGGTNSLAASCGATGTSPERVYQWTPTRSGTVTIDTCSNVLTQIDTVLTVRSPTCTAGPEIACGDDASRCPTATDGAGVQRGSRIVMGATAGTTYFIVVDGYNDAAGAFQLTVGLPLTRDAIHRSGRHRGGRRR